MIRIIYSRLYFYAITASIVLFLAMMSFEFHSASTVVLFINFFLASSYSCLFIFRKLKEEYFYSAVILCGVFAVSLYIFFAFFEKYSHDFKIYLMPLFIILNLMAGLYFLFRKKFFRV